MLVIVVQVILPDESKKTFFRYLLLFVDPWTGSDRDYQYDELLQRVFGIMRDKNPEMVSGKQKKFVIKVGKLKCLLKSKDLWLVVHTIYLKSSNESPKHV